MAAPAGAQTGGRWTFAVLIVIGSLVSVTLGVLGRVHDPTGKAVTTLGFATLLDMKVWLSSAAVLLAGVQLFTAGAMYSRWGRGLDDHRVAQVHRASGMLAVLLTLPVAFGCLWSLGFGTYSSRVLVHSIVGCALYGILVAKLLALRLPKVPSWAVPVLGGSLFTAVVAAWLTSTLWYVTRK